MAVPDKYIANLPEIYRDILDAFPRFNPTRKVSHGLSFASLYSALEGKYDVSEIQLACQKMADGGAMEINNEIFANPTTMGEEIIAALTKSQPTAPNVPPFVPPHQSEPVE